MRLPNFSLALTSSALSMGALVGRAYAACDLSGGAEAGANCATPDGVPTDLLAQIKTITNLLILAIGVISVIMIIVGGFRYALSAGDSKNTTGAKDTILYAVIGLVVALLSYAIANFVLGRF